MNRYEKTHSITTLYSEMLKVLQKKIPAHSWLVNNCGTQTALASIERKSLGIIPMSLNAFKKYADMNIDGGFREIEQLRKKLNTYCKPTNKVEDHKQERIAELTDRLEKSERMRAVLIRAYAELNQITLDALINSPQHQTDYNRHCVLFDKYFGLKLVKKQ